MKQPIWKHAIAMLVIFVLFTGCAANTTAESISAPILTAPLSHPHEVKPLETEPPLSTPEATEPDPTVPFEITAEDVKTRLNDNFEFGKFLAAEVHYYWHPDNNNPHDENKNFAEAIFTYNNIQYSARVKETPCRMSLVFEDLPWDKETSETNIIPGIAGLVRKCRVDGKLYTNILWYNTEQRCTYSLFWEGGREDYLKLAPMIFGVPGELIDPGI